MKMHHLFFAAIVATVGLAACQRELDENTAKGNENLEKVVFRLEESTKLSLDAENLTMTFQEGDVICINGVNCTVFKDDGGQLAVETTKASDNKYNCIFSGPQSYIGTGDNNYKVPNFQIYAKDSFTADAMPMLCIKDASVQTDNVLHFTPLMGVVKIPVNAEGISIRSIKLEYAGFAQGTGATYMSGRSCPFNEAGTEVKTLSSDIHHLSFKNGGTAVMREIVLMCNDAEGNGVTVDGTMDFYFVVEPREYTDGFKVTVTTNDHRVMSARTEGTTTVPVGTVVTMQPLNCTFDANQIFAENFDVCVWGSDPVGKVQGYQGFRGLLPKAYNTTVGTFGSFDCSGIERGHWYSDKKDCTDALGNSICVLCPGSDIFADYTANVFSNDYHGMADCGATNKMKDSFFKYRGLWDWYFSRAIEYHGYVMVGRSQNFSQMASSSSVSATGSPQGALHTPKLTNIPSGESCNVKLSFKIAKDFANNYQPLKISVIGDGAVHSVECSSCTTEIDSTHGNICYVKDLSSLPFSWVNCEVVIKGATSNTFIQIFSPDAQDEAGTNYKTTTYFLDDIYVEKTELTPSETPLKVGFLGDSITTFDGWSEGGSNFYPFYGDTDNPKTLTDVKDVYWYKIVNNLMSNGKLDKVLAYGGTTVINNAKSPRTDFLYRCVNFDSPDVIFIHGGTNDKNYESPLGEYDYDLSEDELDETKYRSAYIKLIKILQRKHPDAQILIIIGDMLTEQYYTSTEEIAKHFGIPYVKFTGVSISKCKGSHPDAAGMNIIASTAYNKFKQYLN